ncbi:hypothetical protein DFS34DRAFT_85744 [Phlyctochytrium arcticum]|nr:hypothetical protein DFS34DRAFT_85744 [Phlyctochytrium arcticum]
MRRNSISQATVILVLSLIFASFLVFASTQVAETKPQVVSKCPIADKCPYYQHAVGAGLVQGQGKGCPLKDKGCPYYSQHKGDSSVVDALVTENDDCPLAKKCKFYEDIKAGKAVKADFSKSACPLADKCPYYEELKKNGTNINDCPVLHACPHFSKKDLESQPHPEGHAHGHAHKGQECPFIAKQKAAAAAKKEAAVGHEEL